MAEVAPAVAPEPEPQPVADPDAQTTVNDFIDYTEYFPSDLQRSLRLIADRDATCVRATANVHDLTVLYQKLPHLPASERPDPVKLRRRIAAELEVAIRCREQSYAEATRLYEGAHRRWRRLAVIRTKLLALPQPPSRDPTPAPVSPQASRSLQRPLDKTSRLHFAHGAATIRREQDRKPARAASVGSSIYDSDASRAGLLAEPKRKRPKDRTPRPRPPRPRQPGPAPISTSTALAMLSPPPSDARPGSRYAPWFKLTEWEMAVLRKNMKKNAMWTPSDTMIRRELERKQRGHHFYELEKARCEAAGEEFLDEEPTAPTRRPPAAATAEAPVVVHSEPAAAADAPRDTVKDDTATVNRGMKLNEAKEAKRAKRETQREQAIQAAQDLEETARKVKEAAEGLKEIDLTLQPVDAKPVRTDTQNILIKRKRESSGAPTVDSSGPRTREMSHASQDSTILPPEPKRLRTGAGTFTISLKPPAPAPKPPGTSITAPESLTAIPAPAVSADTVSTHPDPASSATAGVESAMRNTEHGSSEGIAPPAQTDQKPGAAEIPQAASAAETAPAEPALQPSVFNAPSQPVLTAASSRPRRESIAPAKLSSPDPAPTEPAKRRKTPAVEPGSDHAVEAAQAAHPAAQSEGKADAHTSKEAAKAAPTRPRSSRSHVPTPKAMSEEPKLSNIGKSTRELRRHSIVNRPDIPLPTRTSARRKPPPRGEVSASENGQMVTKVKRARGNKKKKKTDGKAEEGAKEEQEVDIDPNEPRYCICDDVSYGEMIQCDNHCEKEWFHFECVGLTSDGVPTRRKKWYCPDCRKLLGTDAYGNREGGQQALPGRTRANR
ncbi:hypothetical protein M011DRAFT_497160 [Sporormia fimetaria CBS 119925]|uniref:PHD-type domain-containing protein n=1 Tax=Sporormia fimetaria CBS 119925 TaxID=1340428 RepID=A0A6A6V119_9PLEO|nr:hypothetical protein M011DRAFT_497160 [Sporormia fimetaria CBS 119925]